ncbi:MAG: IS30 family transposase [Bdellovibrionaceae bacterium]|nr:IS30 family transposase [Pseudobdellovibrionaceae bacterium]MCB9083760.1 IS30 family transposase [Pseudobdellovibrionaceae bacterium]MCB9084779.1 IS30 family transposase [Pseudobdellovibrionaceae bacterium]
MKKFKRISLEEREEISRLLSKGLGVRDIAQELSRAPSSISRELRRFKEQINYRAVWADKEAQRASRSRRLGKRKILKNQRLLRVIRAKLKLYWSPEQIAQHLESRYEDESMQVSKETIYSYIYILPRGELRAELTRCLRQAHKKRRTRGRSAKGQVSNLEDMISIEERPSEVADRSIPGHWEGDIIIGGQREQTALGTMVERTTRTTILVPLKSKKAEDVRRAFAKEIKKLPKELRLTLTYDQGREMAQHKLFTKETQMKVYFAHPQSPWERGTNENTNGLIRQFFPKGTNFTNITRKEIKRVQRLLNDRPRKTLGWRTPREAMAELLR